MFIEKGIEESKDMLENTQELEKGKDEHIVANPDKSLNQSGFEMLSPKLGLRKSRAFSQDE